VTGRLITVLELAEKLGMKPNTILDQWERGDLPGYKIGRAVRFDLDEVLTSKHRPGARGEAPATPPRHPTEDVFLLPPATPEGEDDA